MSSVVPPMPALGPAELAAIPDELKQLPQWVLWRYERRADKRTKVPFIADRSGRRASSTNPNTWRPWSVAVVLAKPCETGLGFVFKAGGGYVGIDLDHARDPVTGVIEPWAADLVRRLDGYAELSPSGTGIHIIVRGVLPDGRRRKGQIEMYDRARFFTVTGQVVHV